LKQGNKPVGFEEELEKIRAMYQNTIDTLKKELRSSIHKQAALMQAVNLMADSIAERNLLIEELCIYIDEREDSGYADITQAARGRIMP
jgi:predicted RNA binding protein with dsRBD fold (UPF0201 family)